MKKNSKAAPALNGSRASGSVMPVTEKEIANDSASGISGKPYFEVAASVADGDCREDGLALTDSQKRLLEVQGVAIDLLLKAYNSMIELAAVRLQCKLSNTRVSGVARELKELIKVMSVYDC